MVKYENVANDDMFDASLVVFGGEAYNTLNVTWN